MGRKSDTADSEEREGPLEIAVVGDLGEDQSIHEKLLEVEPGGACVLYFDSGGGSAYSAYALTSLILLRGLDATGVIVGDCSSAALWPFAACRRRLVTPHASALFHPMKWHSEEQVALAEAAEWARFFAELENDMDALLIDLLGVDSDLLRQWTHPGRYVSGREMVAAGIAELVELKPLKMLFDK